MMRLKKAICILLCLIMLFCCSCQSNNVENESTNSTPVENTVAQEINISLLYRASDSFNPYTANSKLNRQLSALLFDPLVKLDAYYQPTFVLADNISFNGKECTITLKSALFSDGSPVTADDVIYSYNLAKNSSLPYSSQLKSVVSFNATDDNTLLVKLSKADPYFANLLDFPIIKAKSDKRTDENKIVLPPIGSGRYILNSDNTSLIPNTSHIEGIPSIAKISLINAPDDTVVKHNLETGAISIYNTDLSDAVIPPMAGNMTSVPLNNFIYLGVNLNDGILSKPEFRYAISNALNRDAICKDAYHSYATPATGLFNPIWEDAKGLQNISSVPNMQNVVANLEVIGYNSKDADGFYIDEKGRGITLTLVSYSENKRRSATAELIKSQLEAIGIHINIKHLSWEQYTSALNSGNFDLYIAETKLLNNMDITELITSNGSLSYGIPNTSAIVNTPDAPITNDANQNNAEVQKPLGTTIDSAIQGFYNEKLSLIDIINVFNAELPIIPICYRYGITICDASLNVTNVSSVSDVYFGISNITLN